MEKRTLLEMGGIVRRHIARWFLYRVPNLRELWLTSQDIDIILSSSLLPCSCHQLELAISWAIDTVWRGSCPFLRVGYLLLLKFSGCELCSDRDHPSLPLGSLFISSSDWRIAPATKTLNRVNRHDFPLSVPGPVHLLLTTRRNDGTKFSPNV